VLLVEGSAGQPVAPLEVRLRSARGVFSTRAPAPGAEAFRLDAVLPSMRAVAGLGLGGPLVHVLDREADSLAPYRAWQAAGQHFLVRANGTRKVRRQGEEAPLAHLAGRLPFRRCRRSPGNSAARPPRPWPVCWPAGWKSCVGCSTRSHEVRR
jgi:hypothetical protein